MQAFLLQIAFLFAAFAAEAAPSLSLAELPVSIPQEGDLLWGYQGQEVQIRGFWYPLEDGQGILTSFPNLKSCCVAAAAANGQSVTVRGNFPSVQAQQAVTLAGIFKIEPLHDNRKILFVLEQPYRVDERAFPLLWAIALFGGASLIGYVLYRYKHCE